MNIGRIDAIPFLKYKSVLKTEWVKGNLPTVKRGIYGGTLTRDNISLEHILPRSKNGQTSLFNLALADRQLNTLRGNRPLRFFLDKDKFVEYLEQFENVDIKGFNGKEYIKNIVKTVVDVLESGR